MSSVVNNDNSVIIIHLFVVGFHHKKGCVVEYCYPPILKQSSENAEENADQNSGTVSANDLPYVWKTLPQLSLPDGSHNHERDTIYFHLPDITDHNQTIYGVSCYRQINVEKLIARTSDMTRGTVQKSVVVLSRLPLYGLITAKLEIITHAYFHELDFSKVSVLEETYHSLNNQLNHSMMRSSQELLFGLSPRQLVTTFHHKILILFKLILLEKKVLFYKSPVRELCATILTLCSLVPGMLEKGLGHCSLSVHPKNGRQHSTDMELSVTSADDGIVDDEEHLVLTSADCNIVGDVSNKCDNCNTSEKTLDLCEHNSSNNSQSVSKMIDETTDDSDDDINKWNKDKVHDSDDDLLREIDEVLSINSNGSNIPSAKSSPEKESPKPLTNQYDQMLTEPKPERMDKISDIDRETPPLLKLPLDECGFPLELFSCGSYCHPYLSLTYLDVLTDVRVRSCLVGATNFLFKQKRDIFDVIVEIDSGKIDAVDSDLRKQLSLTTEDLRFVDYLVKTVITEKDRGSDKDSDLFNDGNVDWEGSDDWIRYQFKLYLLHLLRSSELDETSRDYLSFNSSFMTAWRSTHNYKIWSSVSHPGVFEVNAGHPFSGHLSVNDMKLRLSHMLYSRSDQNKKINQTVVRTSKAVGGAITSAKSAVSSWWSNWSSASSAAVVSGQQKTTTDDELKKSQVPEQETQL